MNNNPVYLNLSAIFEDFIKFNGFKVYFFRKVILSDGKDYKTFDLGALMDLNLRPEN